MDNELVCYTRDELIELLHILLDINHYDAIVELTINGNYLVKWTVSDE